MDRRRPLLACVFAAFTLIFLVVAGVSAARQHRKVKRHTHHVKRHTHHHRHKAHKRHKHGSKLRLYARAHKRHDTTAPSAPSSLTAAAGDGKVSLSWHASTDNVGVTGYRVLRGGSTIATVGGSTLSYTNTGLTNGTTYSYTVRATDAAGNVSASSNTVTATPTGTTSTPPGTSHGTLVFDDEFNGTSLDTSKWQANWLGSPGAITGPINGSEKNCYAPSQVTEGGGELDLSVIKSSCTVNGVTYPYRSGVVESNGKFNFTHGYFEARMWTPAGSGMWPGFWTDGQHWPYDGEIDVVEATGGDKSEYHYHYACSSTGGNCATGGATNVAGATTGWHTYAAQWTSSTITFYYDGTQVFSTPTHTNSPMYLILNLATNSTSAVVPNKLRVDYVRVWQ